MDARIFVTEGGISTALPSRIGQLDRPATGERERGGRGSSGGIRHAALAFVRSDVNDDEPTGGWLVSSSVGSIRFYKYLPFAVETLEPAYRNYRYIVRGYIVRLQEVVS